MSARGAPEGSVHREEAVHPPRGSGAPPTVSARANQVDLLPAHEWQRLTAFCSTTPTLYLPLASEGGLPFLRVLGWKGLSAIRAQVLHETEALAGVPKFFDVDISLDGDGQPPLKKRRRGRRVSECATVRLAAVAAEAEAQYVLSSVL